jgi:hypothetical protein
MLCLGQPHSAVCNSTLGSSMSCHRSLTIAEVMGAQNLNITHGRLLLVIESILELPRQEKTAL